MPLNLGEDRGSYFGEDVEPFNTLELLKLALRQSSQSPFGTYGVEMPDLSGPAITQLLFNPYAVQNPEYLRLPTPFGTYTPQRPDYLGVQTTRIPEAIPPIRWGSSTSRTPFGTYAPQRPEYLGLRTAPIPQGPAAAPPQGPAAAPRELGISASRAPFGTYTVQRPDYLGLRTAPVPQGPAAAPRGASPQPRGVISQLPNPSSNSPFGTYSTQRPSFIGPAYTMRDGMAVDQAPEGHEYRWRPGVPPSAYVPTPLGPFTPETQFANALLSGDYNPKSNYGESALAARDAALSRNQGLMAAHSIMAGTDVLNRMAPLAGRANRQTQAYNTRVRVNSPLFRSIRDYLVSDRDPQYRMSLPEADRILARAANDRDLVGEITRRMNATPAERAEMKPPSYASGAGPAPAITRDDRRRYDALNRLADSGAPRNYPEKKPGILENMRKGFDEFRGKLPKFPQIGKPATAQPAAGGGAPSRLLDSRGNPMPSTGTGAASQTPARPLTTFTPGSPRFNGTSWRQPGAGVWNPVTTGAGALNLNNPALDVPYSDPLNTWDFQGRPTTGAQTPAQAAAAKPATDPITAAIDAAIAGAPSGGYDTGYIDRLRADQGAALDAMYNQAFQEQGSHQAKADQTWDEMQAHQNQAPPRIEPLNMFYTMLAGNVAKVLNPNLNTDQQMQSLVNNKLSGLREQRQQQYQLLAEKYRRAGDLADKAGDSARAIKLYKNADMMTNQINALETRAQRDADRQNENYWKRQELQLRREQQREQFAQEGYKNAMDMLENQTAAMLKLDPDQKKPEVQFRLAQLGIEQQMMREALANAKGGWASIQYPGQYGRVERALRTVLPRWKNDPRNFWKETGFDDKNTLLQYGVKRSEIIDYMNRQGLTIPKLKTWFGTNAPDVSE
jgi:hypothetical protein